MCSLLCYKFQCSCYNATYYGKTKRHFKVSVSQDMGVSTRTGKNIKSTKNFTVRDHLQAILLKHCDGPQLNKTPDSAPLMLFS